MEELNNSSAGGNASTAIIQQRFFFWGGVRIWTRYIDSRKFSPIGRAKFHADRAIFGDF